MRDVYLNQFLQDIPLLEHTHNHPTTIYAPFPSGLPEGTRKAKRGDIPSAKALTDGTLLISSEAPKFKLYIPQAKETLKYNPNSTKANFDYFNKK